jgi:CBS domain-containing protein
VAWTQPRTVRDVMTTELRVVARSEPIERAAGMMDQHGVRQLMVIDEHGRLEGLVSYRALLRLVTTARSEPTAAPVLVQSIMEREPLTMAPSTSLPDAVRFMLDHGLSAIPVTEGGRPVGLLSEHDIVRVTGGLLERELEAP